MPQLISFPSPLCRTARRLSNLLWWKLDGSLSKQFASGRSTSAWHSGQRNFPFLWLISACFFKQSQQNVCRQVIVLGSVKVSRQIAQVTCSLRFSTEIPLRKIGQQRRQNTPFLLLWDFGKLELSIASQIILHNTHRQPIRGEIIYPLTSEAEVKGFFSRTV